MAQMERDTAKITVNGKTYTMVEYRKMKAEEAKAKKKAEKKPTKRVKAKKVEKDISIVSEKLQDLIKTMPTLKSIVNYKNHAYKAWGTIAKEIMAHYKIDKPMHKFVIQYRELEELIDQVETCSKRNEKAAFQFVEKVVWKLDDMHKSINQLKKGVEESNVCERYHNHESINGKGKNLGLETITKKCVKTIAQMEVVAKELMVIVENGVDPFHYGNHMSIRSRHRCWA